MEGFNPAGTKMWNKSLFFNVLSRKKEKKRKRGLQAGSSLKDLFTKWLVPFLLPPASCCITKLQLLSVIVTQLSGLRRQKRKVFSWTWSLQSYCLSKHPVLPWLIPGNTNPVCGVSPRVCWCVTVVLHCSWMGSAITLPSHIVKLTYWSSRGMHQ